MATYSRRTGAQLGGGLTEPNTGDFFIRLKSGRRARHRGDDGRGARTGDRTRSPGVDVETAQLMEDLIGDLTAVPQPIEVKLYAEDRHAARTPRPRAWPIASARSAGITEMRDGVVVAGDALDVALRPRPRGAGRRHPGRRLRARSTAMVNGAIATQVQSASCSRTSGFGSRPTSATALTSLAALPIKAADGHIFTLSRIADVDILQRPGRDRAGGRPAHGRGDRPGRGPRHGLGGQGGPAEMLSAPGVLPAGVTFEMGGLYAEQQSAFRGLAAVFAAALAIVTVLLLLLYENFRIVGGDHRHAAAGRLRRGRSACG